MSIAKFQAEWEEIDEEYQQLQETHKVYKQKLDELTNLQATCSGAIGKQRKRLKELTCGLSKCARECDEKHLQVVADIQSQIKEKENVFFDMEAYLPKKNGLYLNLVLGNVNVTLLSNQAKFAYKDEYEKFKLYMTIILMLGAISCLLVLNYRVTDEIFNFLLVWYYCTLTIRESILMSNGSRIKGWWVSHHYVSTFLSGVMLTWPEGPTYQRFRSQFLAFSIYQSFVQFLQYYYQSGCLYRLRALGERNQLDLTVEGFQSWMWRGLTFLLPFLFFGHFWQLYNSVSLFRLARRDDCKEWQVLTPAPDAARVRIRAAAAGRHRRPLCCSILYITPPPTDNFACANGSLCKDFFFSSFLSSGPPEVFLVRSRWFCPLAVASAGTSPSTWRDLFLGKTV